MHDIVANAEQLFPELVDVRLVAAPLGRHAKAIVSNRIGHDLRCYRFGP
jgi:hypothetical protein